MPSFWQRLQSMPWQLSSDLEVTESTVKAAFNRLISSEVAEAFPNHCFCLFIDGLDEYEAIIQTDHTDLAALLNSWAEAGLSSRNIKLCVSSREYNSFMNLFSDDRRLRLHELTHSDMVACVRDKLDRISGSDGFDQLVEDIVEKGQGIFQWVGIVVKNMRYEIDNATTEAQEFKDSLKMLPSEINDLYKHIFDSLRDTKRAYRTLASVSEAMETGVASFSVDAYSFFQDYERDRSFVVGNSFPATTESSRHKLGKTRLRGWGGGLLDTRTVTLGGVRRLYAAHPYTMEVVQFTHHSVRDFLEHPDGQQKMLELLEGFDVLDAISQMHLADLRMIRENCPGFDTSYILFRERHRNGSDKSPYIFLDAWDKFCPDEDSLEPSPGHYDVLLPAGDSAYGLATCAFWGQRVVRDIIETDIGWMNRPISTGIWLGTSKYPPRKMTNDPTVTDSSHKVGLLANLILNCHRERTTHEEEDFAMLDFLFDKGLSDPTHLGASINRSRDVQVEPDVGGMPQLTTWHRFLLYEWMYQHAERVWGGRLPHEQLDARFGEAVAWFLRKGADPYFSARIEFVRRPYNEDELESVSRDRQISAYRGPPIRPNSLRSFRKITIQFRRRTANGDTEQFVVKEEIPVCFHL